MGLELIGHTTNYQFWVFKIDGKTFVGRNFSHPDPLTIRFVGTYPEVEVYSGTATLVDFKVLTILSSTVQKFPQGFGGTVEWLYAGKRYRNGWLLTVGVDEEDSELAFDTPVPYDGPVGGPLAPPVGAPMGGGYPGPSGTGATTPATYPGPSGTGATTPATYPGPSGTGATTPATYPGPSGTGATTPATYPGPSGTGATTPATYPGPSGTGATAPATYPGPSGTGATTPATYPGPSGTGATTPTTPPAPAKPAGSALPLIIGVAYLLLS